MKKEVGFYIVETKVKKRDDKSYFLAVHRSNPSDVELSFIKKDEDGKKYLSGPDWLVKVIDENVTWK